jgi:5S rRNA maturation endonuclease (ribonuclease M5)
MTMTMKTESHLNDQFKLKVLCDDLCDEIESLLDHFDLDYKSNGKMMSMCCPIHGGDNPSAISLYYTGDNYRGNWKCRTHNCEKIFKGSIIGFIRGIISAKKYKWEKSGDKFCSFKEAVDFASKFLNKDLNTIKISGSEKNKKTFAALVGYIHNEKEKQTKSIKRDSIVKSLSIPAQYFIDRRYSSEILRKYDVGLCEKSGKEMSARVVVPIYDNDYQYMVGCSGRSIFEQCKRCGSYHNPNQSCPEENQRWIYSKWRHSKDFKSQNHLYNFWFAKEHIMSSATAIIVESPGNVWRLEENGIHNSVAIFGSSMSDRQKVLLDSSGAMNLVVLTDNDEAGKKAADQIKQKCQNTYKIYIPTISKGDIGEMNSDEIDNEIKPLLEKMI